MDLAELAGYLDAYLRIAEVPDYPTAMNGLQVEGARPVERIAVAVDAALHTIEAAAAEGADLLMVHHGLFWDGSQPVTGRRYRRLKALLDSGMALYSAHLPLDVHPEVGNSAVLARELGIPADGAFGAYRGQPLGVWGEVEMERDALIERVRRVVGAEVRLIPGGPDRVRRAGVITGGAGGQTEAARRVPLDTYITGEGAHHNFFDAMEGGVNLVLAGHYATEVWGVRALARHLEERFGIPWTFIDHPTGL